MAGEADLVGCGRGELGRIADVAAEADSVCFCAGPWQDSQARPFQPTFRVGLDGVMGAFREGVIDIFVADLTGFRAGVRRGRRGV